MHHFKTIALCSDRTQTFVAEARDMDREILCNRDRGVAPEDNFKLAMAICDLYERDEFLAIVKECLPASLKIGDVGEMTLLDGDSLVVTAYKLNQSEIKISNGYFVSRLLAGNATETIAGNTRLRSVHQHPISTQGWVGDGGLGVSGSGYLIAVLMKM